MATLGDIIQFVDRAPGGVARVRWNFERIYCAHCGGLAGLSYIDANGARQIVMDPHLALLATVAQEAYNLRGNELAAGRGLMAGFDGHDGMPTDWQGVYCPDLCRCTEEERQAA